MRRLIVTCLLFLALFIVSCQLKETISLEEMQYCESNDACVYADNSCCPATEGDNIIAINSKYYDYYKSIGEDCGQDYVCKEIYTWPAIEPACVDNTCIYEEELTNFIKEKCQSYCEDNDKESWDTNYLTTKSVGIGSACDVLYDMEEFFPYKWVEEEGKTVCYVVEEDDTTAPESD